MLSYNVYFNTRTVERERVRTFLHTIHECYDMCYMERFVISLPLYSRFDSNRCIICLKAGFKKNDFNNHASILQTSETETVISLVPMRIQLFLFNIHVDKLFLFCGRDDLI